MHIANHSIEFGFCSLYFGCVDLSSFVLQILAACDYCQATYIVDLFEVSEKHMTNLVTRCHTSRDVVGSELPLPYIGLGTLSALKWMRKRNVGLYHTISILQATVTFHCSTTEESNDLSMSYVYSVRSTWVRKMLGSPGSATNKEAGRGERGITSTRSWTLLTVTSWALWATEVSMCELLNHRWDKGWVWREVGETSHVTCTLSFTHTFPLRWGLLEPQPSLGRFFPRLRRREGGI
jgi:hypothetical protein